MPMSSVPQTPPNDPAHDDSGLLLNMADLDFLNELSAPTFTPQKFRRRDAPLDPFILAAALSSGPHVTHHHHFHNELMPITEDSGLVAADDEGKEASPRPSAYVSRQKPRSERLSEEAALARRRDPEVPSRPQPVPAPAPSPANVRHAPPVSPPASPVALKKALAQGLESASLAVDTIASLPRSSSEASARTSLRTTSRAQLEVQCQARTRVPTPHGEVFLHLYHNNWDNKEHLAIVIDSAQLDRDEDNVESDVAPPPIRSRSLDAQWHEGETEMERITRGAYVGRLSSSASRASVPNYDSASRTATSSDLPAPMVRIHSECFTGETIGSMRCDCGEQLDEAMRLIAQPQRSPSTGKRVPGRGAVVYMRQEGRGIGLLEKIRAYNLQDLGHDTVTANLLLGHGADERGYEIAVAILKDLGLGGEQEGVRLLTNNPDKMSALQREGVNVVGRVEMVPRSWRRDNDHVGPDGLHHNHNHYHESEEEYELRRAGATLIGGGASRGVELERYLRTKVERMGHMLDLPESGPTTAPLTPDSDEHKPLSGSMASLPDLVSDSETASGAEDQ